MTIGMVSTIDSTCHTGRELDRKTGLYYYRARYYDPMEGRFVSKDPISFAGGDVNLYGYVQNNPVNWIDPKGLAGVVSGGVQGGVHVLAGGVNGSVQSAIGTDGQYCNRKEHNP